VAEADELRGIALRLAEADEAAFSAVAAAYRLPKTTDEEKATRSAAVAEAVVNAAWPPAQVIGVSSMVVDLAEALVLIGNRNVLSDLAAAAEAAGAAVATARVNVEIDLAGIEDAQASLQMIAQADKADDIIARARQVTAVVREKIRA
jgi:formiminotetrahydrofolate cyclodeaminase